MLISGYQEVSNYMSSTARGEKYIVLLISPTSLRVIGENNLDNAKRLASQQIGKQVNTGSCFSGMPEKVLCSMILEDGRMVCGYEAERS